MPRCIICNSCSDTPKEIEDNSLLSYQWDEEAKGFICNACTESVQSALEDFGYDLDLEYSPVLEEFPVEESEGISLDGQELA